MIVRLLFDAGYSGAIAVVNKSIGVLPPVTIATYWTPSTA